MIVLLHAIAKSHNGETAEVAIATPAHESKGNPAPTSQHPQDKRPQHMPTKPRESVGPDGQPLVTKSGYEDEDQAYYLAEGYYVGDEFVRHGRMQAWYDKVNGERLQFDSHWVKGRKHGQATLYYKNGRKQVAMTFSEGLQTGVWIWFYGDGNKERLETWLEGRKHGSEMMFYQTGGIAWSQQWLHGQRHGYYKEYAADGSIETSMRWENGVPVPD
jgi:hypothetical protein